MLDKYLCRHHNRCIPRMHLSISYVQLFWILSNFLNAPDDPWFSNTGSPLSYFALNSLSDRTSYASDISWNIFSALSLSSAFLSGCHCNASFLYSFFIVFRWCKSTFACKALLVQQKGTFSTSGSTVTTKRTTLDPVNVNMLVYVRENMNKIKLDKLVLENEGEERLEKECNSE